MSNPKAAWNRAFSADAPAVEGASSGGLVLYPRLATPADETREAGVHYIDTEDDDDDVCRAFDRCAHCRIPVQRDYLTGQVATMVGRNFECYGRRP